MIPNTFKFAIHAFDADSFRIETTGGVIRCSSFYDGDLLGDDREYEPSPQDWEAFWVKVDVCGVWRWRIYDEIVALDGTSWDLEIKFGERHVQTSGSNTYPPRGTDYPSEAFKQFLRATGELMHDRDFITHWYDRPWS